MIFQNLMVQYGNEESIGEGGFFGIFFGAKTFFF